MDHTSQESKRPTETETNSEETKSLTATSNPPIKDEGEDEGDETDAVLAVVAAVEQATKSGDVKTSASHSTPVKRKHPPSRSSSTSTPTSATVSGGGGSPSSSAGNLTDSAKRRKKDPSAPKAPLNGYLVYFNEERAGMRAQNPNIGFGELTKIIAAKWKELPTEQKQKYINEADQDKERYEKEMASYKKSDAYKQFLKGTLFID